MTNEAEYFPTSREQIQGRADTTHGTLLCDICKEPMCAMPLCDVHNKHDAYAHVKAQMDDRLDREIVALR